MVNNGPLGCYTNRAVIDYGTFIRYLGLHELAKRIIHPESYGFNPVYSISASDHAMDSPRFEGKRYCLV